MGSSHTSLSTRRRSIRGVVYMATTLLTLATLIGVTVPARAASPTDAATASPVIFVLDASGSMVREVSPGSSRMDIAKKATIDAIGALPSGTKGGMLVFGTGTGNSDAEQAAGCQDIKTLAPFGTLDAAALSQQINGVKASGFTPIGPALRAAVKMLPPGQAGNIVLVSDGIDTCAPPSSCEIASELHRDNPLVSINVVGFGVDADEAARQQMTCIGGVGGGTAVSASNAAQLTSRLKAATSSSRSSTSLSATGTRGVTLGMNLDEVRARVDGAQVSEPKTVDGIEIIYVDCPWGTIELRNNRVYSITPKDASPTAEGITVGSSLSDVEAVYGAPTTSTVASGSLVNVYRAQGSSGAAYQVSMDSTTQRVKTIVVCRCIAFDPRAGAESWEISYDGVGPLTFGMTIAEARAALPQLTQSSSSSSWALRDVNGGDFLTAEFSDSGNLVRVSVSDPRASGGTLDALSGARYPSARGIRIGDSLATAVNGFPGGTNFRIVAAGIRAYFVTDREGHLISFGNRDETITMITVEDAVATRSADASSSTAPATPAPSPTVEASATPGVPAEIDGTWCTRSGATCFSFADDIAAKAPDWFIESSGKDPSTGSIFYRVCLNRDFPTGCSNASAWLLEYFPPGVAWNCLTSNTGGCRPDFTSAHDVSKPRLVQRYNHPYNEDNSFVDAEPMYRQ